MKLHKHAELIKAWAHGAEIEFHSHDDVWFPAKNPQWDVEQEYRIKPEPKPDFIRFFKLELHPLAGLRFGDCTDLPKNPGEYWIKVIFDGETCKPKSAEVLE